MHISISYKSSKNKYQQTSRHKIKLFALTITGTVWEQRMGITDKVTYLSNKIQIFHKQSQTITDCFELDGMDVVKYKPYAFFW